MCTGKRPMALTTSSMMIGRCRCQVCIEGEGAGERGRGEGEGRRGPTRARRCWLRVQTTKRKGKLEGEVPAKSERPLPSPLQGL